MKIIAESGPLRVVDLEIGAGRAVTIDTDREAVYGPQRIEAILIRGGWQEAEDDPDLLVRAMAWPGGGLLRQASPALGDTGETS